MMNKEEKRKWKKEKVANAICQAVIRQNLCDYKNQPILVVDKKTERFLGRKYRTTTRRARRIVSWAVDYGFITLHQMSPVLLTRDNRHEPDIYSISPEFYKNQIKPYLYKAPSNY